MSAEELIVAWKTNDRFQTIKANETYKDLWNNANKEKFAHAVSELNEYIKRNPYPYLSIRIKMYEFLGKSIFGKILETDRNELKELMKEAILLKNQQLLSELYTLYAEKQSENFEDRLFYNSQAIEIQEKIGIRYFPSAYVRYYNLSRTYYMLEEYDKSINVGLKSLKLLREPSDNIHVFCLQSDILALSYYEMNKPDSGIYYSQNLKKAIDKYDPKEKKYFAAAKMYGKSFAPIWKGVSDGSIARGYMMQGKYDEAEDLLIANVESSTRYKQQDDLAKAGNLLAEIYWRKENYNHAIRLWKKAFDLASEKNYIKGKLNASENLFNAYKKTDQYDSATIYYDNYINLLQKHLNNLNESKVINVNNKLEHEKLKNIAEQSELTIRKQNFTRNIIIVSSVFLFTLIGFSYNRYRLKQNLKLARAEYKRKSVEEDSEKMKDEINKAKRQLNSFKEKLIENSHIIEKLLKQQRAPAVSMEQLQNSIILTDEDWKKFQQEFDTVYPMFLDYLYEKYPALSQAEIRYLCLVKLGLSDKEISAALGISPSSLRVTRHRLKQKLHLDKEISPAEFIRTIEEKFI